MQRFASAFLNPLSFCRHGNHKERKGRVVPWPPQPVECYSATLPLQQGIMSRNLQRIAKPLWGTQEAEAEVTPSTCFCNDTALSAPRSQWYDCECECEILVPTLCRADLGWIFDFGPANVWKIAGEFLSEFWWQMSIANFSALFFQGFRPPKKSTPKIHVQNCRYTSPISLSWTQNLFTAIFCLRGRPRNLTRPENLLVNLRHQISKKKLRIKRRELIR